MCRLFAMSGGQRPLDAEFWLLDAPDSLRAQSHRNPDGTGLGTFSLDGCPIVHKAPLSAFDDAAFAREARAERSRTFIAHIRFATTGASTLVNTHPFEQEGRLLAHNGMLGDLPRLDDKLGADRKLVKGETDSERMFALITRETRRHGGDLGAGIVTAATWIAEQLPVHSLNLILTTPSEVYALRYPDTHTLYLLERAAGGRTGATPLQHESRLGSRVHSDQAARRPVVVLASERMDDDPAWRALRPGELLHVRDDLKTNSTIVLPDPPTRPLSDVDAERQSGTRPPSGAGTEQ